MAGVGRANGLLPESAFQVFLASSILTLLATPFLIQASPRLAAKMGKSTRLKSRPHKVRGQTAREFKDHVIIAGYGLNGRNLAHVLKEAGVNYVVCELNPETVRAAGERGDPLVFGDVSSRTILRQAGIESARAIVFAISDPSTTRRAVRAAREMRPDVFILVRTRYASEIDELYGLGANDVIPEEFETSVEIFTRVLERFHVPRNVIDAQVKIIRSECYGALRGTCEAIRPSAERVSDLLSAGTAESFYVMRGSWPAGKTLGGVDLRSKTGATVIAVVRGEESFTSPGAEFVIETGDTLVLVASHRDMNRAFEFLSSGRPEGTGGGGGA
jgi:CPA2 family monovalent cation:H+ antiporter-2